jgi:hypothetical protein
VKGQTSAFLEKSRESLDEAKAIMSIDRHEADARTAYMFQTASPPEPLGSSSSRLISLPLPKS